MSTITENGNACWDFTLSAKFCDSDVAIKDSFVGRSKKWGFQLEKSDDGYDHYQGRMSLIKKKRTGALVRKLFIDTVMENAHFSVTSSENMNNFDYTAKVDSRVDGPWSYLDKVVVNTIQLEMFKKWPLRLYQQWIYEQCLIFCMRSIDLIYDPIGNIGKSLFTEWMEAQGLVEEIPPYRLMDDVFQRVYGRPKCKAYFMDMPRGMKKDKLADLYAGLEVVKNGVCYDKRNYPKKCRFDRPRIFVFTNVLPQFDLMSKDRWRIHRIDENYDVVPWSLGDMETAECLIESDDN